MKAKMFALIAILALVISPLFVMTGADVRGEDEKVTLETVYYACEEVTNTHWVKCDINEGVLVVSNNPSKDTDTTIVELTVSDEFLAEHGVTEIMLDEGFKISNAHKIEMSDKDVYFKTLELDGGTITSTGSGKLVSTGDEENGLSGTGGTADCTFILDNCTVNINEPNCIKYTKELRLCTSPNGTAIFSKGCFEAVTDENSTSIMNLSGINLEGEIDLVLTDTGEFKCDLTGTMAGNPEVGEGIILLSGQNDPSMTVAFDELSLSNVIIAVNNRMDLLFGNSAHTVDYAGNNVLFILSVNNVTIGSLSGVTEISIITTMGLIKCTIDEGGESYLKVSFSKNEGIESIDAEKQFVKDGDTIDLTEVNVVCKSGYVFQGWYCIDSDGNVKKVDDLKFKPTRDVTLFAMATPSGDDPDPPVPPVPTVDGDSNMTLLVITVVLVAIVGVASVIIVASRH